MTTVLQRGCGIELLLRDAVTRDVPDLRDLFRRSSLSNDGDRERLFRNPWALEFPGDSLHRGRCRVAVIETEITGFATSVVAGRRLELEDLFVAPERMRRGVGSALIGDAVAYARTLGIERIEVDGNPHALAFYVAVGFVPDDVVQTDLGSGYRMHLDVPL